MALQTLGGVGASQRAAETPDSTSRDRQPSTASSPRRSWSWPRAFMVTVGVHAALFAYAGTSRADSCAQEIEAVQAKVDSTLDSIAAAGPSQPESRAALLHHQPTPESIARAEQALGENQGEQALAALACAREADRAGDRGLCQSALVEAQRAIGRR